VHLAGDDLVGLAIEKKVVSFDDKAVPRLRLLREARWEKEDADGDGYDEALKIAHNISPLKAMSSILN
jgi:hypothetical protein